MDESDKVRLYNPGSADFESHRLVATPDYITVKPTIKIILSKCFFTLLGLAFIIIPLSVIHKTGYGILIMVIFGFVFFLIGSGSILREFMRPYPYIDLRERRFYPLGKKSAISPETPSGLLLSDIEKCYIVSCGECGQLRHTLILVYPDDQKFILLRHGSWTAIQRDAELLARCTGLTFTNEDSKQDIPDSETVLAIYLLIFGLLWTGFSFFMHLQSLKELDKGLFPVFLTSVFILVGLIILSFGIKLKFFKKQK